MVQKNKKSRRKKNLKIQMHKKINSLLRIGESKHEAKKEYRAECDLKGIKWNPAKSPYIHSIKTAEMYRDTINLFSEWLKENKPRVWKTKDLEAVTKEVCYDYLKEIDENSSAWTTSRHMAGLNKILNLGLTKKEGNLKKRSYKDINRSRSKKENDKKYNPENYREQIDFAKAFGLRRESICDGDYAVKNISLFKEDDRVYCSVVEKGGKYREAVCLREYEEIMEERYNITERIFEDEESFRETYRLSGERLFYNYTKKIDNHSLRREYAQKLYDELTEDRELGGEEIEREYRGFDSEVIQEVSRALGHERLDIVVENYL